MPKPAKPLSRAAQADAARKRRLAAAKNREQIFDLMACGYSLEQTAREMGVSVKTVRRAMDRAIGERRLDAPERYVHLQVARLNKALERVVTALEREDIGAVDPLLKLVAQLDRYHGLAGRAPPPTPPLAPPAPVLALTHAAGPMVGAEAVELSRVENHRED